MGHRRNLVAFCLILVAFTSTSRAQWRHTNSTNYTPEPAASIAANMLAAHNGIRAGVGVPPLHWSDRLAVYAQDWARHLLEQGQFQHRSNPVYGENLFEINGPRATSAGVVEVWASEAHDYDHRSNSCSGVCGHYTQLIWSDTREVGCAVARDSTREVWVCNYNPPGNWVGERPY